MGRYFGIFDVLALIRCQYLFPAYHNVLLNSLKTPPQKISAEARFLFILQLPELLQLL